MYFYDEPSPLQPLRITSDRGNLLAHSHIFTIYLQIDNLHLQCICVETNAHLQTDHIHCKILIQLLFVTTSTYIEKEVILIETF